MGWFVGKGSGFFVWSLAGWRWGLGLCLCLGLGFVFARMFGPLTGTRTGMGTGGYLIGSSVQYVELFFLYFLQKYAVFVP